MTAFPLTDYEPIDPIAEARGARFLVAALAARGEIRVSQIELQNVSPNGYLVVTEDPRTYETIYRYVDQ